MKITTLDEIKEQASKYNPKVKTKVFIKKGVIPQVEIVGQISLKSGNIMSEHIHEKSFEFFFNREGDGNHQDQR